MAILKPTKQLAALPLLLCLCQHLRAREPDNGLGVEGQQCLSHRDCLMAPCTPTAAGPGSPPAGTIPAPAVPTFPCLLQELPSSAPRQLLSLTLYMETFNVDWAAEEFE